MNFFGSFWIKLFVTLLFKEIVALPLVTPCGWQVSEVVRDLGFQTDLCVLDANRVITTKKSGYVTLVKNGMTSRILDISGVTVSDGELGLLSCAVDQTVPFASSPYVYLVYTYRNTSNGQLGVQRLSRFTFDFNSETLSSEKVLLGACTSNSDCIPTVKVFHAGAALAFSPDGVLWMSKGDGQLYEGGSVVNPLWNGPQERGDYNGKILRLDKNTGRGLPDNPWFDGNDNSIQSRIFATGFRNPWTLTFGADFDPSDPEVFVYHVGWFKWESLIRLKRGGNAGWPCYEGTNLAPQKYDFCTSLASRSAPAGVIGRGSQWTRFDASKVMFQYPHDGSGACIIGAASLPLNFAEPYGGRFLGADYVRGNLFVAGPGTNVDVGYQALGVTHIKTVGNQVWMMQSDGGGAIRRISYNGAACITTTRTTKTTKTTTTSTTSKSTKTTKTTSSSTKTSPTIDSVTTTDLFTTSTEVDTTTTPTTSSTTTETTSSTTTETTPTTTTTKTTKTTSTIQTRKPGPGPNGLTYSCNPKVTLRRWPGYDAITYISDTTLYSCPSNGMFGPCEPNANVGKVKGGDGRPMTMNGRRYLKGIGTRVSSSILVNIPAKTCLTLEAVVGIDDLGGGKGWAEFLVAGNKKTLYNSTLANRGPLLANSVNNPLSIAVTIPNNVTQLNLQAVRPWAYRTATPIFSNANWANLRLICGPTAPYLPTIKVQRIVPSSYTAAKAIPMQPQLATVTKLISTMAFSASAWDYTGEVMSPDQISWQINIIHCQGSLCHAHYAVYEGTGSRIKFNTVDHEDCIYWEIQVFATDSCNRVKEERLYVRVKEADGLCSSGGTGVGG